jgi:hypothetical protein
MDVKEIVADLDYKPGWEFRVEGDTNLIIIAQVLHSLTHEPVKFRVRRIIPRVVRDDKAMFLSWWFDMIHEAEFHEIREFARYKGELLDDPHASERVQDD